MDVTKLEKVKCSLIEPYTQIYTEQNILVCDTETVNGKPYTIQFHDGVKATLEYVNEKTILPCYLDYIISHYEKNLSVWFFYMPFDAPIIHYPFKEYFAYDNHQMGLDYKEHHLDFSYVSAKTWFGNHMLDGKKWCERDAYQYVNRGLGKIAKDLNLTSQKLVRPDFLGERAWKTEAERIQFEAYAIEDVVTLRELVYWILGLHRQYDVGLSVSLPDLAGKIFRKHYVKKAIEPTDQAVTIAAMRSYHGGKTESYVKGPMIVKDIFEYDITSAYSYAMTRIGNFFDYKIQPYQTGDPVYNNGVYEVSTEVGCVYKPLYTETFKRTNSIQKQYVTGWELNSALNHKCISSYTIHAGYHMLSHNEKFNGLSDYVWDFFKKKAQADLDKNKTERLAAKLFNNALYGKFVSKIVDECDGEESVRGGVIFHPLIASLITGFVRAYVHDIEHSCCALHTSTDGFISRQDDVDKRFVGVNGLGGLKKEYQGDVLIIRPKVYIIFDKLEVDCHHAFELTDSDNVVCKYCHAKVLKSATHGFYGSVQLLLNLWKGNKTNYSVKRMMRLREATKRRDPEVLPFVFSQQRRSLNVEWSKLTLYTGV